MHPRQFRVVSRATHLVLAAMAGVVVYARPLFSATTSRDVLAFGVMPLLGLSGVAMWQSARVRRLLVRSPSATSR